MRDLVRRRQRGLTMLELIVALAILMITAAIGYPALQKMIARSHLEGAAQLTMAALRQGRLEAIKRSAPAVAVLDVPSRKMTVFIDLNDAGGTPAADLHYNPRPGVNPNNTDYIDAEVPLPRQVDAGGPPSDNEAIENFTDRGDGPRAVFEGDGSVTDVGAFRLRDERENYLEIRVEPAATGRIQLRKWHTPDNAWYTRDMKDGKALWQWY